VRCATSVLAALGALAIASCAVHRLSEGYVCGNNGDCDSGRICDRGFCVDDESQGQCPSVCSSCNPGQRTCRIECSASRPCGSVECPDGFECTVRCSNAGACGDIDCAPGTGCDIECSGAGSCGAINCGKQACQIDCAGVASCPQIDCVDSCGCDVACNTPLACPSMSCPQVLDTLCTRNGDPGATCDSSYSVVCDTCI
jgi:hypothetical protein